MKGNGKGKKKVGKKRSQRRRRARHRVLTDRFVDRAAPRILKAYGKFHEAEHKAHLACRQFARTGRYFYREALITEADYANPGYGEAVVETATSLLERGVDTIDTGELAGVRHELDNGARRHPGTPFRVGYRLSEIPEQTAYPVGFDCRDVYGNFRAMEALSNGFMIFPGGFNSLLQAAFAIQLVQKERCEQEKSGNPGEENIFLENLASRNAGFLGRVRFFDSQFWAPTIRLFESMLKDDFISSWDAQHVYTTCDSVADLLRASQTDRRRWQAALGSSGIEPDDPDRTGFETKRLRPLQAAFKKWDGLRQEAIRLQREFARSLKIGRRESLYGSHNPHKRPDLVDATGEFAKLLRQAATDTVDGGGPGLMEACGAADLSHRDPRVRKAAVGRTIAASLDFVDQKTGDYYSLSFATMHFFQRLKVFEAIANGDSGMGGGFGTWLEVVVKSALIYLEWLEQVRVKKLGRKARKAERYEFLMNSATRDLGFLPRVRLFQERFWKPFIEQIEIMVECGFLKPWAMRELFVLCETVEDLANSRRRCDRRLRRMARAKGKKIVN